MSYDPTGARAEILRAVAARDSSIQQGQAFSQELVALKAKFFSVVTSNVRPELILNNCITHRGEPYSVKTGFRQTEMRWPEPVVQVLSSANYWALSGDIRGEVDSGFEPDHIETRWTRWNGITMGSDGAMYRGTMQGPAGQDTSRKPVEMHSANLWPESGTAVRDAMIGYIARNGLEGHFQ